MKILITGIAGFVGCRLSEHLKEQIEELDIIGIDNLSRRGSESNLSLLRKLRCKFIHGDIRNVDDINELPRVDWILDCAAIPTVMAGVSSGTAQLVGNNLTGTLNLLEKCRKELCGLIMLSTSRVYSIHQLNSIPLREEKDKFVLDHTRTFPKGLTRYGLNEQFSTAAPISLYGATKLASEIVALEYANAFDFPVWINRCGIIAGAGQFGRIDQGVISFWIYQWLMNNPLSFIGFGGKGKQMRDFLSPYDLSKLLLKQIKSTNNNKPKIINVGGGINSCLSLKELNDYCSQKFNYNKSINCVLEDRPFDIPYYITDNTLADQLWDWYPEVNKFHLLDGIMCWAEKNRYLIENCFS